MANQPTFNRLLPADDKGTPNTGVIPHGITPIANSQSNDCEQITKSIINFFYLKRVSHGHFSDFQYKGTR